MKRLGKFSKRAMTLCLATMTVFSVGSFAACNGGIGNSGGAEAIDPDKTQLYISNYNGGCGTEWLYNIEKKFEEEYKDVCFEPGTDKKGVQLIINPNKISATQLTNSFAGATDDVYFVEDVPYYLWVSKGYLADISDVLTNPATAGEDNLENKLTVEQRENLTVLDGKYYALPHYETFRGLHYDVDLFETKNFYFAKNLNNGNNGFVTSKTEERSNGPDGKTGIIDGVDYSIDDGLPSTYEEFYKLIDYMVMRNVTPFVWNGRDDCGYLDYVLEAALNAYSTKVEAELPLTFSTGDDTARVITSFNDAGNPVIENIKIDETTGYYALQQSGRYYALDLVKKMMSKKEYVHSLSASLTHEEAQEQFIYSSLQNKPIAMLVDGTWWPNEAKISGAYDRSVSDYGARAENRNFAWMPLPSKYTAEDEGREELVMKDALRSYAIVHANVAKDTNKLNLAKTFLRYCYTNEALQQFTVDTGIARALQYDLTEAQKNSLTSYARNVWEYRNRATVIYNLSGNKIYMNNETTFIKAIWQSTVSGYKYVGIYEAYKKNVSTKDYFKGLWVTPSDWNSKYKVYFNGSN